MPLEQHGGRHERGWRGAPRVNAQKAGANLEQTVCRGRGRRGSAVNLVRDPVERLLR